MSSIHNRFDITEILGSGGEGSVYLVRDLAHGNTPVALKTLSGSNPPRHSRLGEEFQLLSGITHPNLARPLEYGQAASGDTFLIYEYIPGPSLLEFREEPVSKVLGLVAGALRGLGFLHTRGIVHGDIAPDNLRTTPGGELKIIDFGLSVHTGTVQPPGGTPSYMAPERMQGGPADPRTDLFSLGAVVYHLLGHVPPFSITDGGQIHHDTIRPLQDLRPDLIPGLASWIHRLLHLDPDQRPASARAALHELSTISGEKIELETADTLQAYLKSASMVGNTFVRGELRRIFRCLVDPNERGTAAIALILGEIGTGKSRTLENFKTWLLTRGARVLKEIGYSPQAAPYSTVLHMLERIRDHDWAADPEPVLEVIGILRGLGIPFKTSIHRGQAGHHEAHKIHEKINAVLFNLAIKFPLVIQVDDLHQIDASSMAFFTYLVRNLSLHQREVSDVAPALMFLGTLDLDQNQSPVLDQLVRESTQAGGQHLTLNALNGEEVQELLAEYLGGTRPTPDQTSWALQLTRGNPLFLHELLSSRLGRIHPILKAPGLRLRLEPEDREAVPPTFAGLIQDRLAPLTPIQRRVLSFLSLFRKPVQAKVVASALELEVPEAERILATLVSDRLLTAFEVLPTQYGFQDAPVRKVVLNEIGSRDRKDLHHRAGRSLEALGPEPAGEDLSELAHHYLQVDPEKKGCAYAEKAARWSAGLYAYPAAIELLNRALEVVPEGETSDKLRLRTELAGLYIATGQGKAAVKLLETALEGGEGEHQSGLWLLLGDAHASRGSFKKAKTCFRRCLRESRNLSRLDRIPILLRRAQATSNLGKNTASILLGRFSLRWEEEIGGENTRIDAVRTDLHRRLSHLSFQRGEFQEAEQHTRRCLSLLKGAPLEEAVNLNQMGNIHLRLGNPEKAFKYYERALEIREKHGDLQGMAATLNNLGILNRRGGEQARAADFFRRAIKIQAKIGDRATHATTLNNLANLYYDDAKVDRAVDTYHRSLSLSQQNGDLQTVAMIHANLGGIATMRGDYGHAIDHYLTCLRLRRRLRTPGRMEETLVSIGNVLIELGDYSRAKRLLARVLGRTEKNNQPIQALDARFELGRIEAFERRFNKAEETFLGTLEAASQLGLESLRAETFLALTLLHLDLGRLDEAKECLEKGMHLLGPGPGQEEIIARYALTRIEVNRRTRNQTSEVLAADLEQLLENAATRGAKPLVLDTLWLLARVRQHQSDPAAALDLFQKSTDIIEQMTANIPSERICQAFLKSRRIRRLEQTVSTFRHRLYIQSQDPTIRDEANLSYLKSDLYDIERSLDFTKSRFDKQNTGLKRILDIAHVMSGAIQNEGLFHLILDSIMEITDAERGFVILRDGETGEALQVTAARDRKKKDIQHPESEISYSVVSRVLDEGRPMLLRDAAGDDIIDHTHSVIRLDLRSIMCVPLVSGKETTGVLYVENRSRADRFAEDDLELLTIFAHQAAVALTNAELFKDLNQSLTDLKEAQNRLIRQEKLRLMGEMASGVLHNLKNLLTPVLGHTQILLMDPRNLSLSDDLKAIERLTLDCREVIKRFSNFSRSGESLVDAEPIPLRDFIKEVSSITRTRWEKKTGNSGSAIVFINEVSPEIEVVADASQLREVFINLIYNAVDAMPDGGEIRIIARQDQENVHIEVTDTGVGMTEEVRGKMFDPFFTTKKNKGMGVGMSVTEHIIQQHGGRIDVDSVQNEGTRISIHFPRSGPHELCTARRGQESPPSGNILVVDDDEDVLRFVREALSGRGYTVHTASSGEMALETLSGQKHSWDLVISDLRMPTLSGLEVAAEVKRRAPEVPVIIMTAWPKKVPKIDRHVDSVLSKPVPLQELVETVSGFMGGEGKKAESGISE